MRSIVAQAWLGTIVLFCLGGCTSADHDALAARDASAGPDSSSASGRDGAAEDGATGDGATDAGVSEAGGFEPDGSSVITWVNGLVDAQALRLCFHVRGSDDFPPSETAPWPESAQGLVYGQALATQTLPGVDDLAVRDVQPVAYVGDLSTIGNKTCAGLSQNPGSLLRFTLPVIPAGTLSRGRSLLAVLAGCVGGDAHQDPSQETFCGAGYTPTNPTVTLFLATMTRAPKADRISVQAFGGSLASDPMTVVHQTAVSPVQTVLAQGVGPGEILPRPPSYGLATSELGGNWGENLLQLTPAGQAVPTATVRLSEALSNGGLSLGDLADGKMLTLVWIGPKAGTQPGAWWNGFRALMLKSEPQ